jgi:multidrug efflux system outer membrane protein
MMVLLSGCMVGPDYQRPPVTAPIVFRGSPIPTVFLNLFTYEIDIWGRLRRATEAAQAELLATDWNRKTVITTLISDVASAYFNLLEVDMELAIAKNTLATRESLAVIKVQQQGGAATLLDVRQAEQLVYGAAELILKAERLIEQTENQISLLLGRNPGPVIRSRRRHYRRARCR